MWKRIVAICMIMTLCIGCGRRRNPAEESWPVVSMITVASIPEDHQPHRVYTDQGKMRQILNSLRSLGQKTTPELDPDTLPLQGHTITLFHTDGTQRIYQAKGSRYIRLLPNPWQQADPKKVSELDALLRNLPADGHAVDAASFSSILPLQTAPSGCIIEKNERLQQNGTTLDFADHRGDSHCGGIHYRLYLLPHGVLCPPEGETRQGPYPLPDFDGLTLWGKYYEFAPGAPIELMFHGYRGSAERDLCGGVQRCFKLGHSALIVDQRTSGSSGGKVITFGIHESRDCLSWLDFTIRHLVRR